MKQIWINHAKALKEKARKQFLETGSFNSELVRKTALCLIAADKIRN